MVGWAIGFVGAVVIVVLAAIAYRTHRWLVRSIAPATAVLVVGGVLLFVTDQGQDLGSALLAADLGPRLWFAAALLYWALATWHNARFPLDRAHARWLATPPTKPAGAGERRRSWTPRLLGGVVFLFALAHLALAVRRGGGLGDPVLLRDAGLLAALVVAMAVLYWLFVVYRRRAGRSLGDKLRGRSPTLAERLDAVFTASGPNTGDERLTVATATSTWVAFLFFFLVGLILTVMAWSDPQSVGDRFGSMALGFVAFGGFLSGLVALWMVSERIGWPLPVAVAALLFVSLAVSLTRHYHPVRDCAGLEQCLSGQALADARQTVAEAALDWYAQVPDRAAADGPVPMLIVATAGGGLRAAYWTAVVMGSLPAELGLSLDAFERHTFAVSGVSGGSVGAAFRTALAPDHSDAASLDRAVRGALAHDFLAPTLAALAFVDLPSWVLPRLNQTTRGVALEQAFERAAGARLAAPFLAARPTDGHWRPLLFLNATHQETGRRVIAGHARIDRDPFLDSFDLHGLLGIDVRLSTAAHNSARFSYVSPAGRLAEHGTDADRGWIIDGGYFENFGALTALDVARAALDAIAVETGRPDAVLPVIVQISSDPAIGAPIADDGGAPGERRDRASMDELEACGGAPGPLPFEPDRDRDARFAGNQLLAPLRGVLGSREAHGITASKELARFACARRAAGLPVAYAHFAMCETASPPLGWVLSPGARGSIEAYLGQCDNPGQMDAVRAAFGG
jgi:hypothetical protein